MKHNNVCQHKVSAKTWIPLKTIKVTRDGFGNASKIVMGNCLKCNKTVNKEIKFADMRVEYI